MTCDERMNEIERRLSAFEGHVIQLLADAARAKAPPVPAMPWNSGIELIDEWKTQQAAKIHDATQSKWTTELSSEQPLVHVRRASDWYLHKSDDSGAHDE